jgi:hypothetical protein
MTSSLGWKDSQEFLGKSEIAPSTHPAKPCYLLRTEINTLSYLEGLLKCFYLDVFLYSYFDITVESLASGSNNTGGSHISFTQFPQFPHLTWP